MSAISKAEISYIQASITCEEPLRADGRGVHDYRPIHLTRGVATLANGSARVAIGGTEVIAAVKLEVEDIVDGNVQEGGRISCTVSCSPGAYPQLSSAQQEDVQSEYTALLQSIVGHSSLLPANLTILPGKKAFVLELDAVIVTDSGNLYDVLFMACKSALDDTRVPRTRAVEYKAPKTVNTTEDVEMEDNFKTALMSKRQVRAADFELEDSWDEGEPLTNQTEFPVCITLNMFPPVHILDATLQEEQALSTRILAFFALRNDTPVLHGTRAIGAGHLPLASLRTLLQDAQKHAQQLLLAMKLQSV